MKPVDKYGNEIKVGDWLISERLIKSLKNMLLKVVKIDKKGKEVVFTLYNLDNGVLYPLRVKGILYFKTLKRKKCDFIKFCSNSKKLGLKEKK